MKWDKVSENKIEKYNLKFPSYSFIPKQSYLKVFDLIFDMLWLCVCVLCHFSHMWLSAALWTYLALQAPLFMGFSRQEHWSVLLCPTPGVLPDPEIKPMCLTSPALAGGFFTTSATWEAPTLWLFPIKWCLLKHFLKLILLKYRLFAMC